METTPHTPRASLWKTTGGPREAKAGSWNRAVRQGARLSGHNGGLEPPFALSNNFLRPPGKRRCSKAFPSYEFARQQIRYKAQIILIISISPQSQYTVIQKAEQSHAKWTKHRSPRNYGKQPFAQSRFKAVGIYRDQPGLKNRDTTLGGIV